MSATATAPATAGPRRARLYLSRLDPWTVMKTSFIISIGLAIVIVVATMILWFLLEVTGTFSQINETLNGLGAQSSSMDIGDFLSFGRIMGFALLLAAFEIVLTSALATVIAAIYNTTVRFTGGIEVTLSEDQ